ncbi:MAG: hypothetical protein JWM46_723 [Candidatus Kaiserbacteria bacterium]|nr:hypothetical protein [Candidatus Kaiserbacteria bacterium]
MGGPADCKVVLMAPTAEGMIDTGWKHLQEAHPEQAKNIMNNPKDVNDKWMSEFKVKFDSLEDE